MSTSKFDHKSFLETLTQKPGVYRMIDAENKVLYVGKARNLKNRVTSYFRASGLQTKTIAMVSKITDIQVTATSSETEALLLEQSLIKSEKPPYNILLRDDKSYPYIFLSSDNEFPRLSLHRGKKKKKANFSVRILRPMPLERVFRFCRNSSRFANVMIRILKPVAPVFAVSD
jgi:Nuclease subunit of the excinuclease complex